MADELYSKAQLDAKIKEAVAEVGASANAKMEAAVDAERGRISGIMGLPEYKGREALGAKLIDKKMSVEDAKEILASASVEKPSASTSTATADAALALLSAENPDVKPDASNSGAPQATMSDEDKRIAEARANAKAFNASRKRQ